MIEKIKNDLYIENCRKMLFLVEKICPSYEWMTFIDQSEITIMYILKQKNKGVGTGLGWVFNNYIYISTSEIKFKITYLTKYTTSTILKLNYFQGSYCVLLFVC